MKAMTEEQKEKAEDLLWDAVALSQDYNDPIPTLHVLVLEAYTDVIIKAMQKYAEWWNAERKLLELKDWHESTDDNNG